MIPDRYEIDGYEWRITKNGPDAWVGVCDALGLVVEGGSAEDLISISGEVQDDAIWERP